MSGEKQFIADLWYPTLFINLSVVPMWLVFHCSIANRTDFALAKTEDLLSKILYSYVTSVIFTEYIRLLSIGQSIAYCFTNRILSFDQLTVFGTPFFFLVYLINFSNSDIIHGTNRNHLLSIGLKNEKIKQKLLRQLLVKAFMSMFTTTKSRTHK